jgi:hypothetical protein
MKKDKQKFPRSYLDLNIDINIKSEFIPSLVIEIQWKEYHSNRSL